jgi:signal transduction histidine kinase
MALYVASTNTRFVEEFRTQHGRFSVRTLELEGRPVIPWVKGKMKRTGDGEVSGGRRKAAEPSGLLLPLTHAAQTVGALAMASVHPSELSSHDRRLLEVVAGQLAAVVEHGRLRAEAEARARHLGLIHEVVQHVIGLDDRQQVVRITSDLLAKVFAYERVAVVIAAAEGATRAAGFGGTWEPAEQAEIEGADGFPGDVVAGRACRDGQSVLETDIVPGMLPGGRRDSARAKMCVPLLDAASVGGFIFLASGRPGAFTGNDVLAMESLAGILTAVVSRASQYERLTETIRQLRAAEMEVGARLAAQQDAEGRLVQAAKLVAVGEMAAGVAHELNNPLTTVAGFAELVLDEAPPDAPYRADVGMVLHEALRARGVVRRLLDFARQGEQVKTRASVNEVIEDVLALMTHFVHTSGVQLEVALGEDIPWIMMDGNQMKQVFLNLFHNALHAMPGGGRLQIHSKVRPRDGRDWVVVSVADTGIGIEAQDMPRIFEPFYTTRGIHGGTGLGLSVTYGIITDHGGTIEVESQPGSGSTFSVWLPA